MMLPGIADCQLRERQHGLGRGRRRCAVAGPGNGNQVIVNGDNQQVPPLQL
jgi:hypothetical protein